MTAMRPEKERLCGNGVRKTKTNDVGESAARGTQWGGEFREGANQNEICMDIPYGNLSLGVPLPSTILGHFLLHCG